METFNTAVNFERDRPFLNPNGASSPDRRPCAEEFKNAHHYAGAEVQNSHRMIGDTAPIRLVIKQINRAAPSDATILIEGESGTGKELVARAIHAASARAAAPFTALNCATLSEFLLESDLFGHEKGSFTGAFAQKRGKLEMAENGTLFLDEVSEMSGVLQAKLLRVLQEREFERVGGTRTLRANVRVVAATNRNLEEAVKTGSFRRDLYFRLNVIRLIVPPLRERRQDIPLLARYFLHRLSEKSRRRVDGISPAADAILLSYDWPGNVRELENVIQRALVLGSSDMIMPGDLPDSLLQLAVVDETTPSGPFHNGVREAKRQLIRKAIEQSGGSCGQAARLLGLHPNYLCRLMKNLRLRHAPPASPREKHHDSANEPESKHGP